MAEDTNEINESPTAPEVYYFDPLHVIDTLTNSIYYLSDCELPDEDMKAITSDFTSVMYQCTKLIKAVIKDNIKTLNEPVKNT